MTDRIQPEALRLARYLERDYGTHITPSEAARELRRLHVENATLQAGYDAARLEIESLRDEVKEYRHGAGVQKALIETLLADKPAGEYPALPVPDFGRARRLGAAYYSDAYTADQMRAYADATCATQGGRNHA